MRLLVLNIRSCSNKTERFDVEFGWRRRCAQIMDGIVSSNRMVPTYSRYAGTIIFWALVFNGDDLAERPRRIRANPASGRSVHSQTGRPTAVQHDANVVRRFSVRNSEVLLNSGSEITEVLVVVILGNKEINFLVDVLATMAVQPVESASGAWGKSHLVSQLASPR